MAATLPRLIVIKSKYDIGNRNAYYSAEKDGSVLVGEEDVFSTLVKIEVERSTTNTKYVHLRFSYFNRYWQRKESGVDIVGASDQPEEDLTKPTCTLFEAVKVDDSGVFYLRHVQSGGRVLLDPSTMALYADGNAGDDTRSYLTFVDWNTVVKLPPRVAFKGSNGLYIKDRNGSLEFSSEDPNDESSSYVVELMPDGHVQIQQPAGEGNYWSVSHTVNSWVNIIDPFSQQIKFWPVKMDEDTIALRSADTNNFCRRLTAEGLTDGVSASATSLTNEAIMTVQESVVGRKIYNVVYQMEYARIFDEAPYLAGSASLDNGEAEEANMSVSITYEDDKSYSFTRSLSLTAGVTASIEVGLPFIETATIEVSYEINGTFQWDNTTTDSKTVSATGTVPVPGKSSVTVDYVGTRGTCNIPFSYTQEDRSSLDGKPIYTDLVDGIYTGISYYNFKFYVRDTQPL
ncbi:hypothetical protein SASPL_110090 [Salvia splendens]|uniref:Agglutinin domain-containing protein n=1 Tax=Salvia splendens TaxID=180675 RepID=A0A8X9A157_SALSN|nr:uncharacterized protein LOC121797800 [Salvia splendens]KAG6425882.1 hypothetical protein SASPL_110090 [Salvia splendens]